MKIAFYEPLCKGIEHFKFLSLTISVIKRIFPSAQFYLFAEKSLSENLANEIEFEAIYPLSFINESKSRIKNFVFANEHERSNLKLIKSINFDKIICTSASFYTIKNLRIIQAKSEVYVFYHGILESLASKYKPYNMLYWFRKELKRIDKSIINIVLGDCIKENLLKEIPTLKDSVFAVDLVYPDSNNEPKTMNERIEFAGVGFGKKDKGSEIIFELDEKFSELANFSHIGMMDKELIPNSTKVNVLGKNKPLDSESFDAALKKCDYGLLFYDSSKYRFTASGAIFDIITQHKPVICLSNTYFKYVFDKMGDIGFLCENKDELFNIISDIIRTHDDSLYIEKQKNIMDNIYKFSEFEYEKQLNFVFNK